jgi:hypothetical protein
MALPISCILSKDLKKSNSCGYSLSEVKDIYIANYADVTGTGVDYNCESGVTVSGISMATGTSWYHIEPSKNSVTFTDDLVVADNGKKHRTHTITFTLSGKYDKDLVCPVDALSLGRFVVVVATADGEYLMLGRGVGLEATEGSTAGGGDTNGATIALAADMAEAAIPGLESVVDSVIKA